MAIILDSGGLEVHTPDPAKYHDAAASGYNGAVSSDAYVANPPRGFGGVMLPREDFNRPGMSLACNPHDPANHKMLIDPDRMGEFAAVLDPTQLGSEEAAVVLREEMFALQQANPKGDPVKIRREATARAAERLAKPRSSDDKAQPPVTPPPLLKQAAPARRVATRAAEPEPAKRTLLSQFSRQQSAPPMETVAQASFGQDLRGSRSLPAEPDKRVLFEIPGYGTNESWYHEVLFEARGENTGFLILVYDNRFRGPKYFPPALDGDVGVDVPDHSTVYKVQVPGIKFDSDEKTFCLLFVEDTREGV